MSLGVTDAFVTHSADNKALSYVLGLEVTWVWNSKLLQSKDLQCRPNDRTSAATTGCVSWASCESRTTTSLHCRAAPAASSVCLRGRHRLRAFQPDGSLGHGHPHGPTVSEDVLCVRKGFLGLFIDSLLKAFHRTCRALAVPVPAAVDYAFCTDISPMTQLPCLS